jgi:malonyl-CoA O-methyltransferase
LRTDFARAAASYDEAAVLARETGLRMAERLGYVKLAPKRVADIGCATGDGIRELQQRYTGALPLAVDFALPMLHAVRARTPLLSRMARRGPRLVNADVQALPLASRSLDLVWSNLMLHWLDDPLPAFKELNRVLEVGGLLMFSALGPDTLKELRQAAAKVGSGNTAVPVVRSFHDMHDLGDMLVTAGFADPVMDMEMIRFSYSSLRRFLADQRHLGVRDGLLGELPWREWRRVFAAWERVDNAYPVSFEVVFGHAWKAEPRTAADGRAVIQFHPRPT